MREYQPLKIVMTVAYADERWGGHEVSLCRALARRGHEVVLLTSTIAPPRYGRYHLPLGVEETSGVRIVRLPAGPVALEAPLVADMRWRLRALAADIYHAHESFQPATLWTALACRRAGRPFVLSQHATGSFGREWASLLYRVHLQTWGSWILRQAACVIALTSSAARSLDPFTPRGRLRIIPSGVDCSVFTPAGPSDHRLAGLERPVVLYAGRLARNKDVPTLVRALALLEHGSLVIVGTGPEHEKVRGLCHQLLGAGRYRFLDTVPHQAMPLLYRAADLFVLPSLVEPFGLAALEAMACGTPAIAAAAEGPSSFLPRHLLFPPGDAHSLAARIIEVSARLPTERLLARQHAVGYSWDRVAARIENVYQFALENHGSRIPGGRPNAE
jgi:glycosyltransferase involved in cell wall biosynthesis